MGSFVFAGIALTGAWTQLDAIGWPMWLLPGLAYLLDAERFHLSGAWFRKPVKPESLPAIVAALLLCGVHLLHVVMTAREEFGFGGDEGYHLSATRAFAIYFMKAGPYLAGGLAVFIGCRRWRPRLASSIAMLLLVATSLLLPEEPLFGRYPAAFYLLSTPLNVLFDIARFPYPFTANHVVNMLSVPAWLFALRPIIIGRWPDWRVLPIALLVYFQGPSIVYASSGLLEPWAFVFILLAMEAAATLDPERRWIAVLLAATATFFKDTAILFVPPIWLLTMVEWNGWRPVLRRHAISIGVTAMAPFVTYYAVRRGLHIFRGYEVASDAAVWGMARAAAWLSTARFQLGTGGSLSVAAATAWCVLGFVVDRRATWQHLVWTVTAVALVIFFAADAASIPYTGYGRFLAYPLLAVCGLLFMTTHRMAVTGGGMLSSISVAILLAQFAPATRMLALDFKPDYERNSLEWSQGLVRLPIRSLARRIPDLTGGADVSRVRVAAFGLDPISLRVAYPDLARRYQMQGEIQPPSAPDCGCRAAGEAFLAGFEWPANFADTPDGHQRYEQQQSRCVAQVKATCAAVAFEARSDGSIVGVAGVGSH